MANKKPQVRAIPGIKKPEPLTPEQEKATRLRLFSQSYQSLAQAVLCSFCQNSDLADSTPAGLVDTALQVAKEYMQKSGPAVLAAFEEQEKLAEESRKEE